MQVRRIVFAIGAVSAAFGAAAQQGNSKQDAKVQNVIEVKASQAELLRNETASRSVIGREEILKYGDQSVLDVMKRLPGVSVTGSAVMMRGLGNGYTQILVNGERAPAGFSLETLAPDSVEKIEVLRAATAEYSTQSIAGTINIILKKTVAAASREVRASMGGAPGLRAPGLNLSASDKGTGYTYTVGMVVNHSDAKSAPFTVEQENDALGRQTGLRNTLSASRNVSTSVNLNGRVNWQLGGGDSLSWQAFANGGRFHGDARNVTDTVRGAAYPYPVLTSAPEGHNGSLRSDLNWVVKEIGGGRLDTRLGGYLSRNARSIRRLGWDAEPGVVLDRYYRSDLKDKGATWTGKWSVSFAQDHALGFGWDGGHSRLTEYEQQDDSALQRMREQDFRNGYDAGVDRLAFYAQDEWDITKAWSLYLGMRWEMVDVITTAAGAENASRSEVLSPLGQLLWKIPGDRQQQLRLALTRTYKAPELFRLVPRHFYTSFNSPVSPDFTGNPRLKPELAVGLDLSYAQYWKGGAMLSAAISAREISGTIRNGVTLRGGRWVSEPRNLGKAHVRTLDVEARFPLKAFWAQAPAFDLRANASRNWSSVDDVPGPNNRLERQPAWSANLGGDYSGGAWNGGASLALVAPGWTRNSVPESSYSSGRRDLETYLLYKFNPLSQLRFTLRNALKRDATSISRYQDQQGGYQSMTVTPGYAGWRLQYEHKF